MDPPSKRLKPSPPSFTTEDDFVPLSFTDDAPPPPATSTPTTTPSISHTHTPHRPASHKPYLSSPWFTRRNAQDRPSSRHTLPGAEPWILVKTKLGRRFVHNTSTGESFWRVPGDVWGFVKEFEKGESLQREREENARWAEEQLGEMRMKKKEEEGGRRRRSESLQREDEEAMLAELAAETEKAEERDVKAVVKSLEAVRPIGEEGYGSESSYEEVEVTDSEFEDDDEGDGRPAEVSAAPEKEAPDEGPVEFGEDDIAYQLAAMGEDYGLDPGEYGSDNNNDWEDGAEGLPLTDEDAVNLFHDLLDDHRISPFTPWETLIADTSASSILTDDRYTVLTSTRARKTAWESWVKTRAAQHHAQRSAQPKHNPRVAYLSFLHAHATPKLYWPEFKRKHRKEAALTDRHFADKDREKLYREHISRLKLPEHKREADLIGLLKSLNPRELKGGSKLTNLPEVFWGDIRAISLPVKTRDEVIERFIAKLPVMTHGEIEEEGEEQEKKRADRQRREEALAARKKEVEQQRRQAEKEGRWAKRGLQQEQREVESAMRVDSRRGLRENLMGE